MTSQARPKFNVMSAISLPVAERQGYLGTRASITGVAEVVGLQSELSRIRLPRALIDEPVLSRPTAALKWTHKKVVRCFQETAQTDFHTTSTTESHRHVLDSRSRRMGTRAVCPRADPDGSVLRVELGPPQSRGSSRRHDRRAGCLARWHPADPHLDRRPNLSHRSQCSPTVSERDNGSDRRCSRERYTSRGQE